MWSRHGRSFLSIVLNEVAKRKASQYRDAFPARFELLSSMKLRSVKLRNCRLFRRLVLLHQFLNEVAKRKASQSSAPSSAPQAPCFLNEVAKRKASQ